ncbi:MAG: chromosome segregation protein SMC [Actinobacteria bacterium]|nr:chromosome segregation protein SMC [Actinomycetota bacterium]
MHLKSLTLKGFKSFAQPTTFQFERGVTCVVGPNGSGKSNVVDALAWVMGEQGAKTLRGGKMEDVIFAGTATKGPLGRAEVLLTIDNADGALPIDYTEVTISRTLFRSGGSEYAINGDPCRLLDVQELLSDSGLGREMHVIVGQGQLDSVLRATPEERRGFIEEAAGILKHRRRKEKTERKIEAMQANLSRLSDLAGEVRRQLKPLGAQAEIAREAQNIASQARDAKSRILANDIVVIQRSLETTSTSESARRSERNILQGMLSENTKRLTQLESPELNQKLDRARQVSFDFDSLQERIRSISNIASARVALLESNGQEPSKFDISSITVDIEKARTEMVRLQQEVVRLNQDLGLAEQSRNVARDALDQFDAKAQEQNSLISKFDLELAEFANNVKVAESKLEAFRNEKTRHQEILSAARLRHEEQSRQYRDLESLLSQNQPSASNLESNYEAAQKAVSDAASRIESLRDQLHEAEREKDALAGKRSALNLTLEQKDGASSLTQAQLRGIRGLVANHMRIEPGFEQAIAAALGSLADALVAEDMESGLSALEHLKRTDGGRVEIIIADVDIRSEISLGNQIAGAKLASEVVSAPDGILKLLATVVIVDDLDAARNYFRSSGEDRQVITKQGDVLTRAVLRGGSSSKPSKVELVAERDAAEVALSRLSARIETISSELAQAKSNELASKNSAKQALAELNEQDAKLASQAEQLGRIRVQVEALQSELDRLTTVADANEQAISMALQELEDAKSRLRDFQDLGRPEQELSDRDRLVEALEKERSKELEIRVELGAATERLRVETERSENLTNQLDSSRAAVEQAIASAKSRTSQLRSAKEVLKLLPVLIENVSQSSNKAKSEYTLLDQERTDQFEELTKVRGDIASIQQKLSDLTQSVHDIELQNHEKRLNLANLVTRAQEELGLDEPTLLAEYGPDQLIPSSDEEKEPEVFNRETQMQRLKDAEKLLEKLGRVNPLALEEFAALEQRHKFLTDQLQDLTETRKDLIKIIGDLDEKMQVIFNDAFQDTKKAFEKVFPVLFPGGTGSIFLTDPDNLLSTGLEVNVKPAGKKIERLSLLSGGERSLAAVALMVSIFKARPSPFYVMDEVEAALDDANIGRLLSLFEDLRINSQLIIITHQKRTMEIADALYGVSMKADGISAVVGQRLREKADA